MPKTPKSPKTAKPAQAAPPKQRADGGRFQAGNPGGPGGARPGAGRKPGVARELETASLHTVIPEGAKLVTHRWKRKDNGITLERIEQPHPFAGRSLAEAAWETALALLLSPDHNVRARMAATLIERAHGRVAQQINVGGEVNMKLYGVATPVDQV